MKPIEMDEVILGRRSTRNFSIILSVASLLNALRWISVSDSSVWLWLVSLAVGLVCTLMMIWWKRPALKLSSFVFWISFAMTSYANGYANILLAQSPFAFSPFAGFKLTAFVLALLAPFPALNGYLAILACGIIPTIMYYTLLISAHNIISIQEPALTVITAVVCLMVLFYRNRSQHLERAYAKIVTERKNLRELANIFLVLRDMTNTPIQNIDLTAELLKANEIEPQKAASHLKIAVEKLSQISKILSEFQLGELSASELQSLYNSEDPILFLKTRLATLKARI